MEKKVAVKKLSSTSMMMPLLRVVRWDRFCEEHWDSSCRRLLIDDLWCSCAVVENDGGVRDGTNALHSEVNIKGVRRAIGVDMALEL